MDLPSLLKSARSNSFKRWWLNLLLPRMIPFNRPHGFKVVPMTGGGISVRIPYWRINRNHIKGIHACALATGSEMCSGLSLLEMLDPREFRLIMKSLSMEYHYQAKKPAIATAVPTAEELQRVVEEVREAGVADYRSTVKVEDTSGQHLATGSIIWQVKDWKEVRTRK